MKRASWVIAVFYGRDMMRGRHKESRRKTTARRGVSFATVCELASALPGVEQAMTWGTPGLKLKGRFLARLKEDGESLVLRIGFARRDQLMQASPSVFYITDHYAGYPAVLVRLPAVRKNVLATLLREAWCEVAPESLLATQQPQRARSPRRTTGRVMGRRRTRS